MDIKETEILGADAGRHWYYRSKAEALEKCLDGVCFRSVLDVGAGSGYFSRHMLEHTPAQAACCVDPNYPREWRETVAGKPLRFVRGTEAVAADLVLLMDVLEHVDDDAGLLRDYAAKALPEATFLISVPAFQWLWSAHDVFLGHRRRYTVGQLEDSVRRAGLEVVRSNYFYAGVFPLAAAVRLLRRGRAQDASAGSDLRRHHPLVNAVLHGVCRVETGVMKHNRLFGLSVFCVARRPR